MEIIGVFIVCFILYFIFLRKKGPSKQEANPRTVNIGDFNKIDKTEERRPLSRETLRNINENRYTSVIVDEVEHDYYQKIVGVTFDNEDGTNRQNILAKCKEGEELFLIREKDNKFSKYAIKICRDNSEQLGYYPDDSKLARLLDKGQKVTCHISQITGGGKGESLGCNIHIRY